MTVSRLTCGLILAAALGGCGKSTPPASVKTAPAKVDKYPQESDIDRVTLTPKAAERLGITTARVERKSVQRRRTLGGEVLVPTGRTVVVTAPVPGTLGAPQSGTIPLPGERVEVGQAIFSFVPFLSPERDVPTPAERVQMANARASLVSAQVIADGDVKQVGAEVEAAGIALRRAEQLLQDKVGSARGVDEAQAVLNVSRKKLEAAQVRKRELDALTFDTEGGGVQPIQITAPETGIVRSLSATRGQTVTTGTPLFEVVNLDTVWIRVPVYAGQADEVVAEADAVVADLHGGSNPSTRTARHVAAPPSADAQSATVDLFYELSNEDRALHPGERVNVTVPLRSEATSLVVPWAAVLHDIHGTAWVYEQTEQHVFRRRRVLVKYADGELAVLASGPEPGTEIVVEGAAELFGTEFGTGK